MRHCNKRHFFFVCLFFLFTITGRNEAIIVELKELFVLNGTFITCSGVPIIRFLANTKNAVSPFDIFLHMCIFF